MSGISLLIFALTNLAYIWLCNRQNHVKYMLYGVNRPVESIAGRVFECLGVIVRIVLGHKNILLPVFLLQWNAPLFSANCVCIVTKYRSLKRAFQGDSAGTIAKK